MDGTLPDLEAFSAGCMAGVTAGRFVQADQATHKAMRPSSDGLLDSTRAWPAECSGPEGRVGWLMN